MDGINNLLRDSMNDIIYLKSLEANPALPGSTNDWSNKPMREDEILALEARYNAGIPFPLALRELLRLAGRFCYILDFGLSDTRQELQEDVRELLREAGRTMPKAFFAIDVYNFGDQFLFVYMDEGENPPLYEARYWHHPYMKDWIKLIHPTLSGYIDARVEDVLQGMNPF